MTSSTTYVAFLRALNVAGHSKLKMDVLRQAFAAAGGRNVATYIQTGNVIFDVSARTLIGIPPTYNGIEARGTDDFKKSLLFILT